MQQEYSDDCEVILLYYVPFQNESKTKQQIVEALKPYASIDPSNIQIVCKDGKYSVYITLPKDKTKIIGNLIEIKIQNKKVSIKKYYHDHQIFINKIPVETSKQEIASVFSKFGAISNVAYSQGVDKKGQNILHCFVKFQLAESVRKCFLQNKIHVLGRQVRVLRTYRIGQNQNTDKKLHFKVEPTPLKIEQFQSNCNDYFQGFGQIREKIKLQSIGKNCWKAIIIYCLSSSAELALQKFDQNSLKIKEFSNLNFDLKQFVSKEDQGMNRVIAFGLKNGLDQEFVRSSLEKFGEITQLTISPNKVNTSLNAIVTFSTSLSAKTLLAEYFYDNSLTGLFVKKPRFQFYLNPSDRKEYNNYLKKQSPKKQPIYQQTQTFPNPNLYPMQYPNQMAPFPNYVPPPMYGSGSNPPPPPMYGSSSNQSPPPPPFKDIKKP